MSRSGRKKWEQGFSLVELMIVVFTGTLLIGGTYVAIRSSDTQMQTLNVKMQIHDSAREGLTRMVQEIRQSAPGQMTITGGTSISFTIPNDTIANMTNGDYTIDWDNGSTIVYSLNGSNQIERTLDGGTALIVANDVTALTFTGNATPPTVVTVSLSVQRALLDGSLIPTTALQLTAEAEARNS